MIDYGKDLYGNIEQGAHFDLDRQFPKLHKIGMSIAK